MSQLATPLASAGRSQPIQSLLRDPESQCVERPHLGHI
jgi:hypothetical protein